VPLRREPLSTDLKKELVQRKVSRFSHVKTIKLKEVQLLNSRTSNPNIYNPLIYPAEEKKEIARQYRLVAKKEKKKAKSDAKKQRKQNAILHRRATRNNEKYVKNKDRNRQRALDLERWKIWTGAIHQCERLAAKHDPSGKLFNVGEVVVMPDGQVRSQETLKRNAEMKETREREKKEAAEEKAAREEAKKALKEGRLPAAHTGPGAEGVNPARQALIQNPEVAGLPPPKKKISNMQRKRLELFAPKPIPPKPVIPEGYAIPEGEESFLALWDITDEGIQQRLSREKARKGQERRALRRSQKEQKKINKQLKARKKEAANLGVLFDRNAALKEIMRKNKEEEEEEEEEEGSDSYESEDEDMEFDSDGGQMETLKAEQKSDKRNKRHYEPETKKEDTPKESDSSDSDSSSDQEDVPEIKPKAKGSKRSALESIEDEPTPKKSKKSKKSKDNAPAVIEEAKKNPEVIAPVLEVATKATKKSKKAKAPPAEKEEQVVSVPAQEPELDIKAAKQERKRLRAEEKKRQKELSETNKAIIRNNLASASETPQSVEKASKKRKHIEEETTEVEVSEKKQKKKKKSKNEEPVAEQIAAEQWNPEALTGDAARKEKFLRLLGAGKSNGAVLGSKQKPSIKAKDIKTVQSELERQYETGLKLKRKYLLGQKGSPSYVCSVFLNTRLTYHADGGSKRRGLGA
jgi:hypothetical protein